MTPNNNRNSQAANAGTAPNNNQNPQENAPKAGADNNRPEKLQVKFDDKISVKIDPLELPPIIIQESPQKSITLNLDALSNRLISNYADSVRCSHANNILQSIRTVAVLFFAGIAMLSMADIYLFGSMDMDMSVCLDCIVTGGIVLLHIACIVLFVYCIIYTGATLKRAGNVCDAAANGNLTATDDRHKAYGKLRKLYCLILCAGLAIYVITATAALLK